MTKSTLLKDLRVKARGAYHGPKGRLQSPEVEGMFNYYRLDDVYGCTQNSVLIASLMSKLFGEKVWDIK